MNTEFIKWFRTVSPYIHAHRGKTFVISFGGAAVEKKHQFAGLIHDIALLNSLGIRIVLIHGTRPQIEQCLQIQKLPSSYVNGLRITDETALKCAKAACGIVSIEIESLLSASLSNSPSCQSDIRTTSGNFITARPVGIRDGIDYLYSGQIRRIDSKAIKYYLDQSNIVIISPLGYSTTGETFNLLMEEVATEVAIALNANKWIHLIENSGLLNQKGQLIQQLTVTQAQNHTKQLASISYAIKACQQGVQRVHFLSQQIEASLLLELFTRDGIGTLISVDPFEQLRQAKISDLGGLLELIKPLETTGVLVRRSREKLEIEIEHFIVQERDGMIIGCAALYPYIEEKMAELACLIVHQEYRSQERGSHLLHYLENQARQLHIDCIFILTTQTAHWFIERGFVKSSPNLLPKSKQNLYNYQRNAKVFLKKL